MFSISITCYLKDWVRVVKTSTNHHSPLYEHHMAPPQAIVRWLSLARSFLVSSLSFQTQQLNPSGPKLLRAAITTISTSGGFLLSHLQLFSLNWITIVETSSSTLLLIPSIYLFYFLSIYLFNFPFFLWVESVFLCNCSWVWGIGWFRL